MLYHIIVIQNEYSLKDSFEAVDIIQTIPQELFSEGYTITYPLMWFHYLQTRP